MLQSMGSQRVGHNLVTEQQLLPGFLEYQSTDNVTQKRQPDLVDAFLSPWRGKMAQLPTLSHTEAWDINLYYRAILSFQGGSVCKESTCNAGDKGDVGLIPALGRSIGGVMATHSSILA